VKCKMNIFLCIKGCNITALVFYQLYFFTLGVLLRFLSLELEGKKIHYCMKECFNNYFFYFRGNATIFVTQIRGQEYAVSSPPYTLLLNPPYNQDKHVHISLYARSICARSYSSHLSSHLIISC